MRSNHLRWTVPAVVLCALLGACGRHQDAPSRTSASTDETSQPTVPPPPGDSTPKAADSHTAAVSQGTEDASRTSQSTVGSAASGAPPYTLNGAPEGNKSPGEPARK